MAAATVPFVSVEEYLRTSYEPDADYVDGHIEERTLGEWDHTKLQKAILIALAKGEDAGGYLVAQEQRVQVSATRFRVPDLCLIYSEDEPERIITKPPFLCIELLSPEDTLPRIESRCQDYLRMGVPEIWILDPETLTAHILRGNTVRKQREGKLRLEGSSVELDLTALAAVMRKKK